MKFIIVIVAVLFERFFHPYELLKRFSWFESYLNFMKPVQQRCGLSCGYLGLLIVVIPIVIAVAIVYSLVASALWGFIGFILSIFILVYCLGPQDFYHKYENYFIALVKNDTDRKQQALEKILCVIPEKEEDINQSVTESVFSSFNYAIFTAIFWFMIFGPLAAVLYRSIAEVHKYAHAKDSPHASLLNASSTCMQWIEWLPIRLLGLLNTLVGDFHHGFGKWIGQVLSAAKDNITFAIEVGMAALGITEEKPAKKTLGEIKKAIKLEDHSLILFLVVLALVILGAIIV